MTRTSEAAGSISARLDRLPATRTIWRLVALLSLGGFFEFYDLFFTGYIAPGLVRSGILTASTRGLFGTTGVASFVAAMFSGLFLGTALFGFVADRFGRRTIFTFSLLWYTRRQRDDGVSERRVRTEPVALHLRHRRGRGTGHHRHLSIGTRPQGIARPRLRLQPDHSVLLGAGGGVTRMAAGAANRRSAWTAGVGWC